MALQAMVIETGKNGELSTDTRLIDQFFASLKSKPNVVIHFHGGLVDRAAGLEIAKKLTPVYEAAGSSPVFFVWESGLLEVLRNNITEIAGEDFFKILLKHVTQFVVGKVTADSGKAISNLFLPTDLDVYSELATRNAGEEPYDDLSPNEVAPLTDDDIQAFSDTLSRDTDFRATVDAIADSVVPETRDVSRDIIVRRQTSARSLISPDIVAQLQTDVESARSEGARGLVSAAFLIKHAIDVFSRVILRSRRGSDHGIYPTIVEEILREFYLANVGLEIWKAMKLETVETFRSGTKPRGGYYFAVKLVELLKDTSNQPCLTLVGHSTGAVFIVNMLKHLDELRNTTKALPADFAIRNVIFLAPACTYDLFSTVITAPYQASGGPLYQNFRTFGMLDSSECADVIVPYVYTRSLLYFVSGVLEVDQTGESSPDIPILGMERFYRNGKVYSQSAVSDVRAWIDSDKKRVVWSPTGSAAAGLGSAAVHHGDFDDDLVTLESVKTIIRAGCGG